MAEPLETAAVLGFLPNGESRRETRELLQEAPLTVRLAGRSDISLMRTPGADRELVVGFLLTEGFIDGLSDVALIEECREGLMGDEGGARQEDTMRVTLSGAAAAAIPRRGMLVSSSCGLCGRERIEAILDEIPALVSGARFAVDVVVSMPDRMRAAQVLFERTGTGHAAALFDRSGDLLVVREDIGRHNALDKVIGHAVLTGRSLAETGAMLSGRASFEMVAKAARAGIPLVASVSGPSSLAVAAGEKLNVTLCGFVRGAAFTCYSHPERLVR